MDGDSRSPVLLQHTSPPHTLSPHRSLQNLPSTFQSLTDNSRPSQPEDISISQQDARVGSAQSVQAPMEQLAESDVTNPGTEAVGSLDEAGSTPGISEELLQESGLLIDEQPPENIEARETLPTPESERTGNLDFASVPTVTDPEPLPPSSPPPEEPITEVPDWVNFEQDISTITPEELQAIEGTDADVSALNVPRFEKLIYPEVDDPEQRPIKKIRLSWTINGVRGTREKPNYARVMNSPAAYVDGFYWYIKFFPRGNNASHLSSYIKCSRKPPTPDVEVPENTFKLFQGDPDANLGEVAPVVELKIPATTLNKEDCPKNTDEPEGNEIGSKKSNADAPLETTAASSDNFESIENVEENPKVEEDWRVAAQLGTIIYNPAEPRTNYHMASEHQFNRYNDDWGWTNFQAHWSDIQNRQPRARAPLLQNDTLAIDAYIRIFEDPTQALWWHNSPEAELQWDSKLLAGYFPMGTPPLYHSPGVAGITSWLLLKPVRDVLQSIDTGRWRRDARFKPQPLISQIQIVLFLMRRMRKEEQYVNVNPILETLESFSETFYSVQSFWLILRRAVELELEDDKEALQKIATIFDGSSIDEAEAYRLENPVSIPVEGVTDIQVGLVREFSSLEEKRTFPKFLPIHLNRQKFDSSVREWKLLHDRVRLNEEIDLSTWSSDKMPAKYTLYGFMVHVGERVSGKFYSVLRPNGPGTKWLAFEDGDGNKVFSYTKKRIEDFEGLEGDALTNFKSTRQTAYIAMYVRTDCLKEFLPGSLEPYEISDWLKSHVGTPYHRDPDAAKGEKASKEKLDTVAIEIYSAAGICGRRGLLDMYNLRDDTDYKYFRKIEVPAHTTFMQLRQQIADEEEIASVEGLRLWKMNYGPLGQYMVAAMDAIVKLKEQVRDATETKPLCLWFAELVLEEDINLFGIPEPPKPKPKVEQTDLFRETETGNAQGEDDGVLDLLFIETDNTGLLPAPDSESSAVDEGQQSVAEAVSATIISVPSLPVQVGTSAEQIQSSDDMGGDETPRASPVEHGHLIDVDTTIDVPSTTEDVDSVIASIIAADIEASENVSDTFVQIEPITVDPHAPTTDVEPPAPTQRSNTTEVSQRDPASEKPRRRPVPHVYGFIQIFDVEQQDFIIHDTFFAEWTAEVKETIRKKFKWPSEKDFLIWQRDKAVNTTSIPSGHTFEDIRFRDGVDVIVGDVLSDNTKSKLLAEGKFTTPESLSRYLWMSQRRHPEQAFTGIKTIDSFGLDYHSGPYVNGRPHGPKATSITSSGHTYSGPYVAGVREGVDGTMNYQNGDVYTGTWVKDEKHGQGTFVQKRTGNKYVGGFENGKRWGKGVMYYEVGDEEGEMCQICYGEEMDTLFYDCGHVCACMECARQVNQCPICRKEVKQVVRIYKA